MVSNLYSVGSIATPGYVQGMNDLLSPTMMIMEDEVDSFWCFKGIMDNTVRKALNYDETCKAVCTLTCGSYRPIDFRRTISSESSWVCGCNWHSCARFSPCSTVSSMITWPSTTA